MHVAAALCILRHQAEVPTQPAHGFDNDPVGHEAGLEAGLPMECSVHSAAVLLTWTPSSSTDAKRALPPMGLPLVSSALRPSLASSII